MEEFTIAADTTRRNPVLASRIQSNAIGVPNSIENVPFSSRVIFRGQNIGELARGLAKRTIEWVEVIDEVRVDAVERNPNFVDKNVFDIHIVRRRWGEECEWDVFFDDPETG